MLWLMLLPLCFDFGKCCANYCTIDTFIAEGTVVPVADVIATIDFNLADVKELAIQINTHGWMIAMRGNT